MKGGGENGNYYGSWISGLITMQGDTIVIDGKGHLFGRLASVVAKELLAGKRIVVVRCEDIMISGSCKLYESHIWHYSKGMS